MRVWSVPDSLEDAAEVLFLKHPEASTALLNVLRVEFPIAGTVCCRRKRYHVSRAVALADLNDSLHPWPAHFLVSPAM